MTSPPPIGERGVLRHACLSVCLSVRDHISGTTRLISSIVVHVTCGRGSVLLWRRSDTLRISGFVDDVIFAHRLLLTARLRRQAEAVRLTRTRP